MLRDGAPGAPWFAATRHLVGEIDAAGFAEKKEAVSVPGVSVIIPAYDAARTIEKCLRSLSEQSTAPREVIVVDDGSTDDTPAIAARYARVVRNERGKGAGGARNTGIRIAQGEFLAFTDADCVPPRDWIERMEAAYKDPNVGAVAGGYLRHEGDSPVGQFAFLELRRRRKRETGFVDTAPSNNFSVRAAIARQIGGYPEEFSGASSEDLLFAFHVGRVTRMLWLSDNGVGHHFPSTLMAYLRQQHRFGRDTVVAYWRAPALSTVRTHQGRALYTEAILTAALAPALVLAWPWGLGILGLIYLANLPLLRDCWREGGPGLLVRAAGMVMLRDAVAAASVVSGLVRLALTRRRSSAARQSVQ